MNRGATAVAVLALVLGGCSSSSGTSAGADSPVDAQPAATFAPTSAPPATFAPTSAPPPTLAPTTTTTPTTTTVGTSTTLPVPSDVAARIQGLLVAAERDAGTYSRDLFGGDWIDADGDGCDTRCEVLERERRSELPGLPGGGWLSPYDGYSTPDAGELDVDHTVHSPRHGGPGQPVGMDPVGWRSRTISTTRARSSPSRQRRTEPRETATRPHGSRRTSIRGAATSPIGSTRSCGGSSLLIRPRSTRSPTSQPAGAADEDRIEARARGVRSHVGAETPVRPRSVAHPGGLS